MKWKYGALSKGIEKWVDEIVKSPKAKKAAQLWRNHATGRVWRRWEAMLMELKCKRVMATKAVKICVGMMICTSWRSWLTMVDERKGLWALTRRVLLRFKHRLLSKAMNRWNDEVIKARKAKKAAQLWKHHATGRAWRGWESRVEDIKRLRHTGSIVIKHWRNEQIAVAWERWYEYTIEKHILSHKVNRAEKPAKMAAKIDFCRG